MEMSHPVPVFSRSHLEELYEAYRKEQKKEEDVEEEEHHHQDPPSTLSNPQVLDMDEDLSAEQFMTQDDCSYDGDST